MRFAAGSATFTSSPAQPLRIRLRQLQQRPAQQRRPARAPAENLQLIDVAAQLDAEANGGELLEPQRAAGRERTVGDGDGLRGRRAGRRDQVA